jgi:hypothetical protein
MSKYRITGWYTQEVTGTYTIEVEAYSEEEAKDMINRGEYDDIFFTEKAGGQPEYDIYEPNTEVEIV